ncbi:mycothiol transferase [Terracoccus luteus]|jgi:hypothetical protein|uniref:Damage-inducible protein DinB n=2 Tax=Terracoccus luteus TaxID=53356 RepID=A0A839PPS8_9MICO|nr:DUF664 domain-containing protein [Terracoccus luteus]MBB2985527.1 hypothetical protein [Terracoccus luteus]MCP2171179.1 hypothetical protein [Terracoccus luteus]
MDDVTGAEQTRATTPDAGGPAPRRVAPPWEPPMAGDEVAHLLGSLERMRATFRWKADGLDADGLRTRVGASALTLGSLLKHLALVEDLYSTVNLDGSSPGLPWTEVDWEAAPDWPFSSAADDPPAELYALHDAAVDRARGRYARALSAGGLDQAVAVSDDAGEHPSLRRMLHDVLEEYARHVGHADLLREAVDGRVGEDPPDDWRPGGAQEA